MPALICPYCGAYSNFTALYEWTTPYRGPNQGRFTLKEIMWAVWSCESCDRPIVGVMNAEKKPVAYHPKHFPDIDMPDVPQAIADDTREAFRCHAVEAWRAAAAMARRAIQATAYDKGAPKVLLIGQIDWLAENGHITEQMRGVAHRIRLGGNLGAHPDADGLKDVNQDDAEAVLEFLGDFLRYVYTIPARLSRLGGAT